MSDSPLWIEKYRPQTFSEVKGQKAIVSSVKALVEQKTIPHLLFSGPSGVGKSTLALVVAKSLYGDQWRDNFLELNASDDRGIDVVRSTIKDFARTQPLGDVSFKIILLDESDSLTKDAQQALRRTMERYSATCRFILSCNYSSRIIDPIQSRCTIFRFKPLEKEFVTVLIKDIASSESLSIDKEAYDALYTVSKGDVRRVENVLQSCAALSSTITADVIYQVSSAAKPQQLVSILEDARNGNFLKSRQALLDVMLEQGLSGIDLLKHIQQTVHELSIDEQEKMKMILACGEIEFRMVEGSDEFVQLEALLASFAQRGDGD